MKLGIDVSYHNGKVDWQAVKNRGVEFVMCRSSYGPKTKWSCTVDETFFDNVEQAHKAGLLVGSYHYSYALNPQEAKDEAKFVKDLIMNSGISLDLFCAFDMEDADSFKANNNFDFSMNNCTNICQAYIQEMQPLNCGVYASLSWFDDFIDWQKLVCAVWSAQTIDQYTANNGSLEEISKYNLFPTYMWQFTFDLNINGKIFDANILYV